MNIILNKIKSINNMIACFKSNSLPSLNTWKGECFMRKPKSFFAGITILAFILPVLIPLIIFWLIPILTSLGISFTNWDYMTPDFNIVGFKNYRALLKSSSFRSALLHTLVCGLQTVIPSIILGLTLAMLVRSLNR